METDRTKRRLKEFKKIRRTGTSTEFDRGYKKAVKEIKELWRERDKLYKELKEQKQMTQRLHKANVRLVKKLKDNK